MRWALKIVGVLLTLIGVVWSLQGIGLLRGSPMTGQGFWAGAGLVSLIVGLALLYLGVRRGRAPTL